MINFPIISHTDILYSIFENRMLMSKFSESQLNHLKDCIDIALKNKALECSDYSIEDE